MSTDPLQNYIQHCVVAISYHNPEGLRQCLTINPGLEEGQLRASFRAPNDFDLYAVPEPFKPVIISHLDLMRAVYKKKSMTGAFALLDSMVNHLVRACETHTNWVNPALINSVRQLGAVFKVMDKTEMDKAALAHESTPVWEQLVNTVSRAFKIVLNDKNLDTHRSKRQDIYFFVATMIKIYFRLNKLEMAKLVEKALAGARIEMPPMDDHKADASSYLYYSGLLSLGAGDYSASVAKLERSWKMVSCNPASHKHSQQILTVLIPLKLYTDHKVIRNPGFWKQFPALDQVYRQEFVRAITQGNLFAYEQNLDKLQSLFLGRNMYLVGELLRLQCQLNLIRRTAGIVASLEGGNHIVPLSAFQVAYHVSSQPKAAEKDNIDVLHQYSLDHIECILANLIAGGKIKGYISHANRCIVLSKTNAFPPSNF